LSSKYNKIGIDFQQHLNMFILADLHFYENIWKIVEIYYMRPFHSYTVS